MRACIWITIVALAISALPGPSIAGDGGGSSISRRSREYERIRNQPRVVINNNYYGPGSGYPAPPPGYVIYDESPDYYYYQPYPENVPRRDRRIRTAPVEPHERYNILDKSGEVKVWSRAPR